MLLLVFSLSGCGASFSADAGRVVSPNYPDHYPHNSNCDYLIDAGDKTVIVITFKTFQVEGRQSSMSQHSTEQCFLSTYNNI